MKVVFLESKPLLELHVSDFGVLPGKGHSIIIGNQRYIVTAHTWAYALTSDPPNTFQSHTATVVIDIKKDVA